jgi:branched-chain amino acid transport system substrate-binding protein
MSNRSIAVGIGTPLSGSSAALGNEMKQAAELAVEEWNARGGVAGARVQTVVVDDGGTPTTGEIVARALCSTAAVVGVVGHYNSDVTMAAAAAYADAGLTMITPVASNPALTEQGWPHVFRLTNRDDATARAIAEYMHGELGKRRAAVVESRTAYGRSMAEQFVRAFGRIGGTIASRHDLGDGERDFTPIVEALPSDVDVIFYGGSFEGAPLLCALRAAGVPHLFAAGDGCWDVENFLCPAGAAAQAAEGVLVLAASLPEEWPGPASSAAARYRHRHGAIGNYALNSYDAARVLLQAIDDAARECGKTPDRVAVLRSMRSVRFEGTAFAGRLEWDAKGDNVAAVTMLHAVRGGRFDPVAIVGRGRMLIRRNADPARRALGNTN